MLRNFSIIIIISGFCYFSLISIRAFNQFKAGRNRYMLGESIVKEMVANAGGAADVLSACQKMAYEYSPGETQFVRHVYPEEESCLPEIIGKLPIRVISVTCDFVEISLDKPGGYRIALLAFNNSADQFGTSVLTNGLWYWNYKPSKETYKIYKASLLRQEKFYKTFGVKNRNERE